MVKWRVYSNIMSCYKILPEDEIWKISKYCAKMIFICSLIFLFLIKIRFPKGISISEILTKRYGQQGLKIFRETEKVDFKLKKIKCDIEFLKTCISNNRQQEYTLRWDPKGYIFNEHENACAKWQKKHIYNYFYFVDC